MNSNQDILLENQRNIIRALTYSPTLFVDYIHYRKSAHEKIQFKGSTISIPNIPFISYNNADICCIVNDSCSDISVVPLGPKGKIGIPYIITNTRGEKIFGTNDSVVAKISKLDKLYSKYRSVPPTSLSYFINDNRAIKHCISDTKLSNIKYIASDEFTNETLIAYVLNYLILENLKMGKELPVLFVRHYESGVCQQNKTKIIGVNIMENCDLGSLDKIHENKNFFPYITNFIVEDNQTELSIPLINEDTVLQILTQITVGLHMLQTLVNFTSGDLKAGNIFVKSEPIDMKYIFDKSSITLKAPFTCKIADYGKSSCMLYKTSDTTTAVRFFNENNLANIYLSIHPFEHEITIENQEYYYSINTTFNSQVYTRTRHMGIPFYYSFDYYTVLVSILTNPAFYYMFFATEKLRTIFWDPIWDPTIYTDNNIFGSQNHTTDSEEAMKRIRRYAMEKKGQSIADAINILRGLKLKCSAINLVLKQIATNPDN